MAINKDLETYKNSKEFKDIITKANNKIDILEAKIDAVYNEGEADWTDTPIDELKHKMTHNEFDVKDRWIKDLTWIIDQIKEEKGKELKDHYEFRINNANLFLYQAINRMGASNSILRYTELDMLRVERAHLFGIENDIDALIGADAPDTPKTEGAF